MPTPDYTIRYSNKAKRLQLRISKRGLEVVIPARRRVSQPVINEFVQEHQSWIEKNQQRLQQLVAANTKANDPLPATLELAALNQRWEIHYLTTGARHVSLFANLTQQITLMGNVQNKAACIKKLKSWLKRIAEIYLREQLDLAAQATGLTYKQLTIRNNSSRWGSCSANQHISLCCKLLFLPPHLLQHILLHELCHTKIMHHGKSFWRLLSSFDPDARLHSRLLRQAALQVPGWVS